MLKKQEFPYSYISYKYAFEKNISMLTNGHIKIGSGDNYVNATVYIMAETLEDQGYDVKEITNKLDIKVRIPWDKRKRIQISINDTGIPVYRISLTAWNVKRDYLIHSSGFISITDDIRSGINKFVSEIEGKWKVYESKRNAIYESK